MKPTPTMSQNGSRDDLYGAARLFYLASAEKGVSGASHRNGVTPHPFSPSCPSGHLILTYPGLSKEESTEKVKATLKL